MREFKLPSGAVLKIGLAPFTDAKALWQAMLKEIKGVELSSKNDVLPALKDLLCLGFSSPAVEMFVWKCLERCTLNGGAGDLKIVPDTFEDPQRREDFVHVCLEVTKDNISPFMKSLYAESKQFLAMIDGVTPT